MSKKRTPPPPPAARPASAAAAGPMDVGMLEQMFKLMAANDVNTVDVRDGDRRYIIKRGATYAAPMAAPMAAPVAHAPAAAPAPAGTSPAATPPPPAADPDAGLVPIKSPMVGTFYVASGPDAKPFVSVGSAVGDDTDVCVIEAMKVFNNIKAECRGTIAKVVVANGESVEFNQVLFLVKP